MLQQFLVPQLDEDDQEGPIHFQQDGAPPHYLEEVREYLKVGRLVERRRFHGHLVARILHPWIFLWGFVKDRVFVPPLPHRK
jgi:hypothetical protein